MSLSRAITRWALLVSVWSERMIQHHINKLLHHARAYYLLPYIGQLTVAGIRKFMDR